MENTCEPGHTLEAPLSVPILTPLQTPPLFTYAGTQDARYPNPPERSPGPGRGSGGTGALPEAGPGGPKPPDTPRNQTASEALGAGGAHQPHRPVPAAGGPPGSGSRGQGDRRSRSAGRGGAARRLPALARAARPRQRRLPRGEQRSPYRRQQQPPQRGPQRPGRPHGPQPPPAREGPRPGSGSPAPHGALHRRRLPERRHFLFRPPRPMGADTPLLPRPRPSAPARLPLRARRGEGSCGGDSPAGPHVLPPAAGPGPARLSFGLVLSLWVANSHQLAGFST